MINEILPFYNVKLVNITNNNNVNNGEQMNIFVINLNSNIIRRNYINVIMKKMELNYTLINVDPPKEYICELIKSINPKTKKLNTGEIGCFLSHMWGLNKAINDHIQRFIIFEDDIVFHKNFNTLFNNIITNKNYDYLLLGASDYELKTNIQQLNEINHIYIPKTKIVGAYAIMYSLEAAKYVFNFKSTYISSFDDKLIHIFKHFPKTSGVCFPNIVCAELSTTNIGHNFTSFKNKIAENIYYKYCYDSTFQFKDYHFMYFILFYIDLPIKNTDTYESYTHQLIDIYFDINNIRDKELQETLKNRLNYDYFTLEDIKQIKGI